MDLNQRLSRLGGVSALVLALTLLISLFGIPFALPALRSWLVVLFELNAGFPTEPLGVLHALDFAILVLASLTFLGLWPALSRRQRGWLAATVALPLAGIGVLLITRLAGRSALMGSGLVVSVLLLRQRAFRALGILGAIGNALLLSGDFTTGTSASPIAATLVGVGYLLVVAWFFGVSASLLRRSASHPPARLEPGDSAPHPAS